MVLCLEQVDAVALGEGDDRPLGVGTGAEGAGAAVALALALAVERVHAEHLDVEDRLDGVADLGLAGVGVDAERVDVLVEQGVGLLAHDRLDDDVAGILHWSLPSPSVVWLNENPPAGFASSASASSAVGSSVVGSSVAASFAARTSASFSDLMRAASKRGSVFSPAGFTRSDGSTGLTASPSFFGRLGRSLAMSSSPRGAVVSGSASGASAAAFGSAAAFFAAAAFLGAAAGVSAFAVGLTLAFLAGASAGTAGRVSRVNTT